MTQSSPGEPEFNGEITLDDVHFDFSDAPNPAVGVAIIKNFMSRRADQITSVEIDYSDDGSASIILVLADGRVVDDIPPIDDANLNNIRAGLANVVDDGGLETTPTTIVPTDADFLI